MILGIFLMYKQNAKNVAKNIVNFVFTPNKYIY